MVVVVVVGQSVAGHHPMDQDLDHKMVDKEQVHRLAMDFLVHSSSEAVVYCEVVVVHPSSEAVEPSMEVVVVRPSEAVDPSMEVVDRNYRMTNILPKV